MNDSKVLTDKQKIVLRFKMACNELYRQQAQTDSVAKKSQILDLYRRMYRRAVFPAHRIAPSPDPSLRDNVPRSTHRKICWEGEIK